MKENQMVKTKLKVKEQKSKFTPTKRLTLGQAKVLRFLKDHIRHTKREIAESTGLPGLRSVKGYLKLLRKKGYIISATNKGVCLIGKEKDKTYLDETSETINQCLSNIEGALNIGDLVKKPLMVQVKFFKLELDKEEMEKLTKKMTEISFYLVAGQTQKAIEA